MANFSNIFENEVMIPSPLQRFEWLDTSYNESNVTNQDCSFYCKRDDLIHPTVSGNKWRKLQGALCLTAKTNPKNIVSFGGGYSNHLHALAYLCFKLKIPFTAVIRGHYEDNKTPMIKDIESWGTSIKYVSKADYRLRDDEAFLRKLSCQYNHPLIIPEGGSSALCFRGMRDLMSEISSQLSVFSPNANTKAYSHNYIILPVASAGTLSGLINAVHLHESMPNHESSLQLDRVNKNFATINSDNTTIIGVAVLKGEGYLENLTTNLLSEINYSGSVNWSIEHQYHSGGYAKSSPTLIEFIDRFNAGQIVESHDFYTFKKPLNLTLLQKNIKVESVYSGKLFYAIADLLKNKRFQTNSRIIALHTGGMQGAR